MSRNYREARFVNLGTLGKQFEQCQRIFSTRQTNQDAVVIGYQSVIDYSPTEASFDTFHQLIVLFCHRFALKIGAKVTEKYEL
jgi:hypothetical protein